MQPGNTGTRTTRWLRWLARGIGSFVAAYWLFMGLAYGIGEPTPWEAEDVTMACLILASVLGVIVAWWREGIGGLLLVIVALAHSIFAYIAAGHSRGFAVLISGGPFLLIGGLFLLVWYRSRAPG